MKNEENQNYKYPHCGIVMPISEIDGCPENHWSDVLEILREVIISAGFTPNLVSNSDSIGIIQNRIVQNILNYPMIICDVSGRNPNVMFELGIRLAFDKPVVIIKDDKTGFSFDTSMIEHIMYPRDLRYTQMVEFKKSLLNKLKATYQESQSNPNYSAFLKHFGVEIINGISPNSEEIDNNKLDLVLEKESKANTVWVVSPELFYDVNDPDFIDTVKNNYSRGTRYFYIVPDNVGINQNIKLYQNTYNKSDEEISNTFLLLEDSFFNGFMQEIVIYDGNNKDYFSYLYSRDNAQEKDDILVFSKKMTVQNIDKFKKVWLEYKKELPK